MDEPVIKKFGTYVMAPESISTVYFINPSHQSVCLYVYSMSLLGNGSVKASLRQRIQRLEELFHVIFYAVRVASKESTRLRLPKTFSYFKLVLVEEPG
jgi:hypothetical protein